MNDKCGMWIDHREAVLVAINEEESEIKIIQSNVERHFHPSGGARSLSPYAPHDAVPEQRAERRRFAQLKKYYHQIINELGGVKKLYLFGPGLAKKELSYELNREKSVETKIVRMDSAKKMSKPQIRDKVENFYEKKVQGF